MLEVITGTVGVALVVKRTLVCTDGCRDGDWEREDGKKYEVKQHLNTGIAEHVDEEMQEYLKMTNKSLYP